jgi:hypothetical protein
VHGSGLHHDIPRMEHGMLLALAKVFPSADPEVQSLRGHAYGRVHRTLAACYFEVRALRPFVRHALKSVRYDPGNIRYFAAYPLRVLSRAFSR